MPETIDRTAFDDTYLDRASRGDPVLKEYLRKRMRDFLDYRWADRDGAMTRVHEQIQAAFAERYPGREPTYAEQRSVVTEFEKSSGLTLWRGG